jgi:hypothetical protein
MLAVQNLFQGRLPDISGSVLAIIAYSFGWNNRT